jgi:hypothetical protein
MLGYLEDEGIEHTTTAPCQPQSNGIAERVNRTLMGKVRAMLSLCNLGYEFWPTAVLHAAYLHNRTPSSTSGSVTPYERLYGRVPSLGNLRIFGCLAYAEVPDEKRKRLFEKSIRTALLECLPGMQYKVLDLDNGDIHYVRHVKFDEHQFPADGSRTGKLISEEEADKDLESNQDSTPDYAPSTSSSEDDSDSDCETNDSDDDYRSTSCNLTHIHGSQEHTCSRVFARNISITCSRG